LKNVKAILSDWGNVAVYFDNDRTAARLAPWSGRPFSEVRHLLFRSPHSPCIAYEKGRMSTWEFREFARHYLRLDEKLDDAVFDEAYSDIFTPNWEVLGLLARARNRGFMITAVSNIDELRHAALRKLGLESFFDRLTLSYRELLAKPSAELMVRALDRSGVAAEEALFVDDIAANLEPARELGIRVHQYADFSGFLKFLSDQGLTDLAMTN